MTVWCAGLDEMQSHTNLHACIHEIELCVKLVIYKDYTEMHDQQNIKFRT